MIKGFSLRVNIAQAILAVDKKANEYYAQYNIQPSILALDILGEAAKVLPTDIPEIQSL
jgi:uncharacterized protein with HEPN domain